jgi:hypothetical protein
MSQASLNDPPRSVLFVDQPLADFSRKLRHVKYIALFW